MKQTADQWPHDISSDGNFLLYFDSSNSGDLWALPLTGSDRKPIAIATTEYGEGYGEFSPDRRWVAFDTNESGRFEVVVQAFPEPFVKLPVSTDGGVFPRWNADGTELYFVADGMLMAAGVHPAGSSLDVGKPVPLFRLESNNSGGGGGHPEYAVSRDGRFLVNNILESSNTPITLILNWKPKSP